MARRKKKKHWRSKLQAASFPADIKATQFKTLIESIVQVARGNTITPRDILLRFNQGFKKKINLLYKQEEIGLLIQVHRDSICTISEEDLSQQCYLYLIELWEFYKIKWKKRTNKIFYDYARSYLSRWMGYYVGQEIEKYLSQGYIEKLESVYSIEEREITNLSLGWVFLKTNEGKFKDLNIKQKYLLYLRFNKDLSIKEISGLINQHNKDVEKELSVIKKILGD
jgi:hypothetical protein